MRTKVERIALYAMIFATICVVINNVVSFVEYLKTGYAGSTAAIVCFIVGDIILIIGWILYFRDRKINKV